MTRQPALIAALLLFVSSSIAPAAMQDELPLELTEPQSASTSEPPASGVLTRPGRQREQSASDTAVDTRLRTTNSRRSPRTGRHSEPVRPAVAMLELISADAARPEFFSGPVPRTKAVGEDATLNDVCCIGDHCRAVGERGVVCQSDDGGQSWITQLTPFECSLRSVCFVTNKVGWIAGLRFLPGTSHQTAVLLQTRDGGQTWHDLAAGAALTDPDSTASLPGILHLQCFGVRDAVAVTLPARNHSGHGIFHSSDGCQTWSPIPTDRNGGPWSAACFLNASDGIVVGQHQSYTAVVSRQAVVINPPQPTLRQVRGVSLNPNGVAWIVGDGGFVLTTANAGVTWQPSEGEFPDGMSDLTDLRTVDHRGSTVLIAGNPGCAVLRSDTGGSTWSINSLPLTGQVSKLRFTSDNTVLAIGSFGQILRSDDRGISWRSVRSTTLRAGVMTLVTDAARAPWELLSNISGENGIRAVAVQLSQPLDDSGAAQAESAAAMTERTQMALTQLGGNETTADWMFPRTRPEHHRSSERLIAEWNRQTDGRLRTLLPLRIARDIRNWRPSLIVIEPASDDDAVASILCDVMTEAARLAASQETDADLLQQFGLSPWSIERVVTRVAANRTATLAFDAVDLLPALGTTVGLQSAASTQVFEQLSSVMPLIRSRVGYEILSDWKNAAAVQNLFDGLQNCLKSDARRPYPSRNREDIDALNRTLRSARMEAAALTGLLSVTASDNSFIAELQTVGARLPDSLALKQLRDLASLNLQHYNIDGYLAVQQEVTRRFPASEDARLAAEMLFLLYSSAEARHYRMHTQQDRVQKSMPTALPDSSIPGDAIPPQSQSATAQSFPTGAANSLATLQERWDSNAAAALKILLSTPLNEPPMAILSPAVLLRRAANLRIQQRDGEHNSILSVLGQRVDAVGLFAQSEMQVVHLASSPVLPLLNLPRHSERPFLDGVLTDPIWEYAQELPLTPFVSSTAMPGSADDTQQEGNGESPISSLTMLAWDEEFLYLAARLERSPQKSSHIRLATHRSHDAAHDNLDRLELEIDTDRDFTTAFRLTVDESGQTSDRCWLLDNWNPDWFVAVDSDDVAWRIEVAIPLTELSAQPAKAGDLWSIRLRRIIPGVLEHELHSGKNAVSTDGTVLLRFIRPKVRTPKGKN